MRLIAGLCLLVAALFASGSWAQMAPAAREAALSAEFARLLAAGNPAAASMAEQNIWRLWFTGPSAEATDTLEQGVTKLREGNFEESERILTALILDAPNYAEAWNQRAFARFLNEDFEGSLADIERVLMLEPRHFGALAGRARIETRMGRFRKASKTMGEVGGVHPWMARNSPIPADPPPPPPVESQEL